MRSSNFGNQPYHLIPVKPGDDAIARRWNLVIIAFLAMLVLGLFTLALVPQADRNAFVARQVPYQMDERPAPQALRWMIHSSDRALTPAPAETTPCSPV